LENGIQRELTIEGYFSFDFTLVNDCGRGG